MSHILTKNGKSGPQMQLCRKPRNTVQKGGAAALDLRLLVARLQQFMDEGRGGIESDRQRLLTGRETEPETNVGLAGAAVADRDAILPAGHILRAGELQHEGLVERRNGGEIEAVQALHGQEPRLLDGGLLPASLMYFCFGRP